MIHAVASRVKRVKRMIKNECPRAVLVFLISLMLMSQVSFAETDLISAVQSGNLSQVISLVEKGADVIITMRMELPPLRGRQSMATQK